MDFYFDIAPKTAVGQQQQQVTVNRMVSSSATASVSATASAAAANSSSSSPNQTAMQALRNKAAARHRHPAPLPYPYNPPGDPNWKRKYFIQIIDISKIFSMIFIGQLIFDCEIFCNFVRHSTTANYSHQ